jgi:hypothetical protein
MLSSPLTQVTTITILPEKEIPNTKIRGHVYVVIVEDKTLPRQ